MNVCDQIGWEGHVLLSNLYFVIKGVRKYCLYYSIILHICILIYILTINLFPLDTLLRYTHSFVHKWKRNLRTCLRKELNSLEPLRPEDIKVLHAISYSGCGPTI